MAEYASVPEYSKGNYIHRLYLNRNPLIQGMSHRSSASSALTSRLQQLIAEEDMILSSFARQLGKTGTPTEGISLINDMLTGSDKALKALADIAKHYIEQNAGSGRINFSEEQHRKVIIKNFINILQGRVDSSSVTKDLQEGYNALYKDIIKKINNLTTAGDPERAESAYSFEGRIHELVVVGIFNLNLIRYLSIHKEEIQQETLNIFQQMAIEASAKAVGDQRYTSGQIATGSRYYSHDMSIPLMDMGEGLNIQLKAKPKSSKKEVRLVSGMEIENLISNVDGVDKDAIKTALINQHFWGLKSYKALINSTIKSFPEMGGVYSNLSSADPTALERLDYSKTINVLQPAIPVLESAIFDHLITGISDAMDTHLWIITDKGGYTIIRSSAIISRLMGNTHSLRDITRKGTVVKQTRKGLDELIGSGSLVIKSKSTEAMNLGSYYKKGGSHSKWYQLTSGIADATYNRMKITMTFDYANMK